MDLNIALLPEPSLGERITALSRRLAERAGSTLLLDGEQGPFPHLTLFMTGFPDDCRDAVIQVVRGALLGLSAPALRITSPVVSKQGSVLLNVEKTPALDHLHRWMIHKLNPMRMDAQAQIWEARRDRFGPKDLEQLANIGFPHALDAWSPHFTIGRVARDDRKRALAALGRPQLQGCADHVGIGAVGEHGTIVRLEGAIPLDH